MSESVYVHLLDSSLPFQCWGVQCKGINKMWEEQIEVLLACHSSLGWELFHWYTEAGSRVPTNNLYISAITQVQCCLLQKDIKYVLPRMFPLWSSACKPLFGLHPLWLVGTDIFTFVAFHSVTNSLSCSFILLPFPSDWFHLNKIYLWSLSSWWILYYQVSVKFMR